MKNSLLPSPQEMNDLISLCKTLAGCPYYQKLGAGGVLAIFLTAREMNLPPMMCLNGGMYTFSGAVSLSAQLMNMMIVNAGHEVDILECTHTAAEVMITRGDRKGKPGYKPFVYRYTLDDAKVAGLLSKNNWRTNARDMLFNRCLSGCSRKHTPEATMGAYAIGELEGDGHIIDVSAPQAEVVKEVQKESEPKKIENHPDYDYFITQNGLTCNSEGNPDTDKMEYVLATCQKTNMGVDQVINAAIKHQDLFEQRFDKWRQNKYSTKQC